MVACFLVSEVLRVGEQVIEPCLDPRPSPGPPQQAAGPSKTTRIAPP